MAYPFVVVKYVMGGKKRHRPQMTSYGNKQGNVYFHSTAAAGDKAPAAAGCRSYESKEGGSFPPVTDAGRGTGISFLRGLLQKCGMMGFLIRFGGCTYTKQPCINSEKSIVGKGMGAIPTSRSRRVLCTAHRLSLPTSENRRRFPRFFAVPTVQFCPVQLQMNGGLRNPGIALGQRPDDHQEERT